MSTKSTNTMKRVINGFLFVVWVLLGLMLLFSVTIHGKISISEGVLFNTALFTSCLYPIALILSRKIGVRFDFPTFATNAREKG